MMIRTVLGNRPDRKCRQGPAATCEDLTYVNVRRRMGLARETVGAMKVGFKDTRITPRLAKGLWAAMDRDDARAHASRR
jgi:hypothetical protein